MSEDLSEMLKSLDQNMRDEMKTFLNDSIKFCQDNLDKNKLLQLAYTSFSENVKNLPETKTYYQNLLKHQKGATELLETCKNNLENLPK